MQSPDAEAELPAERDDPNVSPQQLVEELRYSRQVLNVVEYDNKLFEESSRTNLSQNDKIAAELRERKELAESAIRGCENADMTFLRDVFVRFGRSEKEALAFLHSSIPHVKSLLKRKITYASRGLDLDRFRRVQIRRAQRKKQFQHQQLQSVLDNKKIAGDVSFRTDITNGVLKRIARETRELIQGLNGMMVYMDLINEIGGRFSRVKEYVDDDATNFEKSLKDLQDRISFQEKETGYLAKVFVEASKAKDRAEQSYANTGQDGAKAEAMKERMLKDLEGALQEHRDLCTRCVEKLVGLNEHLKNNADSCFMDCQETVKRFPHSLITMNTQCHSKRASQPGHLEQTTQLNRTYETLQELTKANGSEELIQVFRDQAKQANTTNSAASRLEYLLRTVLRPECDMFQSESEKSESRVQNRRLAIEKAIGELQDRFDSTADSSRSAVSEQRDNVQEHRHFAETLESMNVRIGRLCESIESDVKYAEDHPGVDGLLDLADKNVEAIVEKLSEYLTRDWETLQELVNDSDFLEYRASKLPSSNNRVQFDSFEPRANSPVFNPKFVTNAQFKMANAQILERARQVELARLKAANAESEKEKAAEEEPKEKKGKKA